MRQTVIKNNECQLCKGVMVVVEDLVFEVCLAGERIIIPNLRGLKCPSCDKIIFDENSNKIIEKYTSNKIVTGYEIKVSVVGGRKIGLYFPKDILRVMKINQGEKAILTPLSKRRMILEFLD